MEYVKLAPTLGASSRLGFGCGSVMGRVGREPSLRAIAAALDAGITHFDVARLYGYGEAESLVGAALRGKRDRVVIASKFGLVAPRAASALRGLKPLAQKVFAAIPGSRTVFRSLIGSVARPAERFSVGAAQQSLDESLSALKTDYLDILFLHECDPEDLTDELTAFLDAQVGAGKIRCYGIASSVATAAQLARGTHPDMIFQFANSICGRGAERLPARERAYAAHSPFAGGDRLRRLRSTQPELFHLPGGRLVEASELLPMMLSCALAAPSVGVVLCSMLSGNHLEANLATVERPPFTAAEIDAFAAAIGACPDALIEVV